MFRNIPSDLLFYRVSVYDAIEVRKKAVNEAAEAIPEKRLRGETLDALAEEIAAKCQIEVPVFAEEEITVSPPREVDIELNRSGRFDYGFDGTRTAKGTAVTFSIPFKGDAELFSVRPSTHTLNALYAEIRGNVLARTVSGTSLEQSAVKSEFEGFLRAAKECLACLNKDVASFNSSAKGLAYGVLQTRYARLQKGDDLVSGLGYKVK